MARRIIQICVNQETGKSLYLLDYKDGILSYRVSTEPSILEKDKVEFEGSNVLAGSYFFHQSYLQDLIEKNK